VLASDVFLCQTYNVCPPIISPPCGLEVSLLESAFLFLHFLPLFGDCSLVPPALLSLFCSLPPSRFFLQEMFLERRCSSIPPPHFRLIFDKDGLRSSCCLQPRFESLGFALSSCGSFDPSLIVSEGETMMCSAVSLPFLDERASFP